MLGSPLASVDVNVNSRNSAQKAKVSKQYQKKSHLEHSESKVVGETTRGAREMHEEWGEHVPRRGTLSGDRKAGP